MSLLTLGAVTVAGYRLRTGDATSLSSAVSAAIEEAEEMLEEELRRGLANEERTETLRIYPTYGETVDLWAWSGRVYPRAWPITASTLVIDGRALFGATPDNHPFTGIVEPVVTPRATITYTGGFTAATLPVTLAQAIYDLAKPLAQEEAPALVGASSMRVGDVSVTYTETPSTGIDALVPGLSLRIRRYRNRWA